jgi:FkbM family methyltransferase
LTVRFFNSLQQIVNSESVGPLVGICRHLSWQARRTVGGFPCELTLSHSRLLAEGATGVPALVNAMGMYDFHNMSLIRVVLERRPATFVDVGANIGPYTIVASEYRTAHVVSIEPHPATFAMLTRNVQMNKRENVACFNLALSDHDGQADLTDKSGSSINRLVGQPGRGEKCVAVPCRTLDALCAELNVRPDILKIDVEGHEVQVIDGFRRNLQSASLLLVEGGERPEIRSAMRENGFLGPLYFHHGARAFLPSPQRRAEDPVYLNTPLLRDLPVLRIKILS